MSGLFDTCRGALCCLSPGSLHSAVSIDSVKGEQKRDGRESHGSPCWSMASSSAEMAMADPCGGQKWPDAPTDDHTPLLAGASRQGEGGSLSTWEPVPGGCPLGVLLVADTQALPQRWLRVAHLQLCSPSPTWFLNPAEHPSGGCLPWIPQMARVQHWYTAGPSEFVASLTGRLFSFPSDFSGECAEGGRQGAQGVLL